MARLLIVEDNSELASLIASAAQARGHAPVAVYTGRAAIKSIEQGEFDVAVVDLLLPDMRGGEVLDALKAKAVPALAVSGVYKGDRFARQATELHGAREFFEKPFDMRALLSAIDASAGAAPKIPPVRLEESLDDLEELMSPNVPVERGPKPRHPVPRSGVWPTRPVSATPPEEWDQAGDLAQSSVPKLLNAFYEAGHRGELKLKQDKVVKVVYFESGQPVYAASNLIYERFGRFCVRQGVISESDMGAIAELCEGEMIRTGEAMVRLGLIDDQKRKELLEAQVREIIWSTFGWTKGQYTFAAKKPARADMVKVRVFPGELILQGVLRTETLVTLRQKLRSTVRLYPTVDPPYALNDLALTGPQARLLAYADGSKAVEDLLRLADSISERESLAALYGFELLGLLEERRDEGKRQRISFGL